MLCFARDMPVSNIEGQYSIVDTMERKIKVFGLEIDPGQSSQTNRNWIE